MDINYNIKTIWFENDTFLCAELADGRLIKVPVTWYPRLANATEAQRNNWRLIANGDGIHWPDIDEDISARSMLALA